MNRFGTIEVEHVEDHGLGTQEAVNVPSEARSKPGPKTSKATVTYEMKAEQDIETAFMIYCSFEVLHQMQNFQMADMEGLRKWHPRSYGSFTHYENCISFSSAIRRRCRVPIPRSLQVGQSVLQYFFCRAKNACHQVRHLLSSQNIRSMRCLCLHGIYSVLHKFLMSHSSLFI